MQRPIYPFILSVVLTNLSYSAIDEDNDGLSDVWEELFSAQSLSPSDDSDGDTYTNLEECVAGTDPLNNADRPLLNLAVNQTESDLFEITFNSLIGKKYALEHSADLNGFNNFGLTWNGTSSVTFLSINRDSKVTNKGSFQADFWSNLATNSISDLNNNAAFPNSPDGRMNVTISSAPTFLATGYGASITSDVLPTISGSYRFYISSSSPAQLYIANKLAAEVLPTQIGLKAAEWETYDTQRSEPITLTAGNELSIGFRYVANTPLQHTEIAWSGPGIDGIQKITQDSLAEESVTAGGIDMGAARSPAFFKLKITNADQDSDGIPDWEELALAKHKNILFFDPETTDGTPDTDVLQNNLLNASQNTPEITLIGTDAAAFENNFPSLIDDSGSFTMTRTGSQAPLTVKICVPPLVNTGNTATQCDGSCCSLIGSAGEEAAEATDYQIIDEDGNIITDSVYFEFGETEKKFIVRAVRDNINEYPETLNLAVKESTDNSYTPSSSFNGASIQIFDLPDSNDNISIFTGPYTPENGVTSSGSGSVTVTINGPRTEIKIWSEFNGLGSNLSNSHFHKASIENTSGDVVHGLSQETILSMTQDRANASLPLTEGNLVAYTWNLLTSSGAISSVGQPTSKQVLIDSLFSQNGETPLYFNLHTENIPGGEIWAFFNLSEGSVEDPGDALPAAEANSSDYPLLSGDLLESDVRRFLNQATFGATDDHVSTLLNTINTERQNNPTYHRQSAFSDWLDDQINPVVTPQSYMLDFMMASNFQNFTLSGFFDPARNVLDDGSTPAIPEWPHVIRTSEKPEHWYLSAPYPITKQTFLNASGGTRIFNPGFGIHDIRPTYWQLHVNGRDQLRHKMGFALQQIMVASNVDIFISGNSHGSVNYQDMINAYAFSHYRDVLGTVNWNPVMGHWLSSIKNQKALDFDGDGIFDTFPDENLARENMQLFSIGLFERWSDGSLKLTNAGLPKPSYSNADITEFAKIITGQSVSYFAATTVLPTWGGAEFVASNNNFNASHTTRGQNSRVMLYPMKMFGEHHSLGSKTFAGTTINNMEIEDLDELATADFEQALDWLAGKPGDGNPDFDMVNSHVSTPSFVSRLLIQRFTTSNPSREYLHRVATVFKNTEGNLEDTIKAILLDPEVRNIDLNETQFGLKKSPLEAFIQMARSLNARTGIPLTPPANNDVYEDTESDYSNPNIYLSNFGYPASQLALHERNIRLRNVSTHTTNSKGLQMDHMFQDSVFNYYLPDYKPAGIISESGLVSPEMQIASEPSVTRNINYFNNAIYNDTGLPGQIISHTNASQYEVFGASSTNNRDHMTFPLGELANSYYPSTAPLLTAERTSESLADESLMDAVDLRLTNGLFKIRYPYDKTDNSPDNPREIIIDHITASYNDPYDGDDDAGDRLYKIKDVIYLLTASPEYQIRK